MVVISRLGDGGQPVSLERVAQLTHISKRYLEQLMRSLRRASLLRSVAGRKGGYLLSRPAEQIDLCQIIEASIGPLNIVHCVGEPETCLKSDFCECRPIYLLINERISEALREYSLADMTDAKWRDRIQEQLLAGFGGGASCAATDRAVRD